MAKAVGPLLSIESHGRAGPLVANTARGNKYIKSQVAPTQPHSARQMKIRAIALTYVRLWATLTDANRLTWRTYAEEHKESDWTGTSRKLSGINWYVRCNTRLVDAGITALTSAPSTAAPGCPVGFTVTKVSTDIKAAWTAPVAATLQVDIWVDGPHSAGRATKMSRIKHLVYEPAETTTPVVIIAAAAAGTYDIYARVLDEATGLTSLYVTSSVVV